MRKLSLIRELLVAIVAIALLGLAGCGPQAEATSVDLGGSGGGGVDEGTQADPMHLSPSGSHSADVSVGGVSYYYGDTFPVSPNGIGISLVSIAQAAKGGSVVALELDVFDNSVWSSPICTTTSSGSSASPCNLSPNIYGPTLYFSVSEFGGLSAQYTIVFTNL